LGVRKSIQPVKKLSDEVLAWLPVCSQVQVICVTVQQMPLPPYSLASLNPDCPGIEAVKRVSVSSSLLTESSGGGREGQGSFGPGCTLQGRHL